MREPKDLIGKKVGIQATGVILLRALLAKNKIAEKDVTIVTIGADMAPLLTGQVDVVTGWLTNTTALKVLGDQRVDMRLWDTGVRLYALPYYATTETLTKKPDILAKFLRATAKGWAYTHAEPEKAVDFLIAVLERSGYRESFSGLTRALLPAAQAGNPKAKAALDAVSAKAKESPRPTPAAPQTPIRRKVFPRFIHD